MLNGSSIIDRDSAAAVNRCRDRRTFARSKSSFEDEFAEDLNLFEGIHSDLPEATGGKQLFEAGEFAGIVFGDFKLISSRAWSIARKLIRTDVIEDDALAPCGGQVESYPRNE